MSTKTIERILNSSFGIVDHEVELDNSGNAYTIDLDIEAPRDNQDWNNLMKIKNKIRSEVNRAYKLKFVLRFTT